jgi:hypothetical protein
MRRSIPHVDLPAAPRSARVRVALATAVALLAGTVFAADPIKSYPVLRLKDGRTLSSVAVINYTTGGILVRHLGGATTVRAELLPASVQADLNVRSIFLAAPSAADTASTSAASVAAPTDDASDEPSAEFAAIEALRRRLNAREWEIASRVALPEGAAAPAATPAAAPASDFSAAGVLVQTAAPAPVPATEPETAVEAPASVPAAVLAAGPAPAGEGNIPEFFSHQKPLQAEAITHTDVVGRIVVTPQGVAPRFLTGVEVRAYPAATFPGFLAHAKARAQSAAQRLLDQAVVAATEKRLDDHATLTAKAERIAARYLDYLPEAPFQARTDAEGHFTLRHDLREVRLVAIGYARADRREWTYEWVGLTPARDLVLNEANATSVNPADHTKARFAAR